MLSAMRLRISLFILISSLLSSACSGPSKEELRRMQLLQAQRAELAAQQAQQAALRRQQIRNERIQAADQALAALHTPTQKKQTQQIPAQERIKLIFSDQKNATLPPGDTYFQIFQLQPAKYNYAQNKQSFSIVGMRNLPDSKVYSPLFPDESARYQPGQKAKSVLEFTLLEETELNRLGQPLLKENGNRWVAATLNIKNSSSLSNKHADWVWEPGLFEDLSWLTAPEISYPYTAKRELQIQIGFRLCQRKNRCYLNSDYQQHPTQAVRAEVLSAVVFNTRTHEVLARFISEVE